MPSATDEFRDPAESNFAGKEEKEVDGAPIRLVREQYQTETTSQEEKCQTL